MYGKQNESYYSEVSNNRPSPHPHPHHFTVNWLNRMWMTPIVNFVQTLIQHINAGYLMMDVDVV